MRFIPHLSQTHGFVVCVAGLYAVAGLSAHGVVRGDVWVFVWFGGDAWIVVEAFGEGAGTSG